MLPNLKHLVRLSTQVLKNIEFQSSFFNVEKVLSRSKCDFYSINQKYHFHTDKPRNKHSDILEYRKSQKAAVSKVLVKDIFHGDLAAKRKEGYFPTCDLQNQVFHDMAFKDIPIIHIHVSRNNTIMSLCDRGSLKILRSCGREGFKNARKGTNVAAQTTGIALGMRAIKMGYNVVKVLIKGLGPGRLSSIKGLQLAGLNVVSISDRTVDFSSLRARKQRRL